MNSKDGDEKDEEGRAKDKIISWFLNSLGEELTDRCSIHLEIAVYCWIGSVAQATPEPWTRED
jgi:hypothetical protein